MTPGWCASVVCMTYSPNNPGYPAPQQPGGYPVQGAAPGAPAYPAPPAGPSRLPVYFTAAVAATGLAAYLASFGPLLKIKSDIGPFGGAQFTASGLSYWTVAALVASLLAVVGLLPKGKTYTPIVAVTAVLGVLLVIGQMINRPNGFSIGWALWMVLLLTVLQAVAAVTALLFESGVLSPPAPRPQYGQFGPYGPPPAGYYPGAPGTAGQGGQRPGYPTPYGSYPSSAPGPVASGQGAHDDSTSTPPHGFPSYTPPPSSDSPAPAEPGSTPGATPS